MKATPLLTRLILPLAALFALSAPAFAQAGPPPTVPPQEGRPLVKVATDGETIEGEGTGDSPLAVKDGAIGASKLKEGAVTPDKVNPAGATPGQVLTATAAGVAWQTPAAPAAGAGNVTAFKVTATASNMCSLGVLAVDHPLANDKPDAIVTMTALVQGTAPSFKMVSQLEPALAQFVYLTDDPNSKADAAGASSYDFSGCPAGRWLLLNSFVGTTVYLTVANP